MNTRIARANRQNQYPEGSNRGRMRQRTFYLNVHEHALLAEILCVKGSDYSSEGIGLHNRVTCLLSMSTQSGPDGEVLAISSRVPNVSLTWRLSSEL